MPTLQSRPPRSSWGTAARRTYDEVASSVLALSPSALTGLYAACDLIDAAETMQRTIAADGRTIPGSQGQPVAHPLIGEVRLYRREALGLLRALAGSSTSASAAASALAGKRWASHPAGKFVGVRGPSPLLR